jgi:2-iminobutanoate/2-iminopropanoate deaminase
VSGKDPLSGELPADPEQQVRNTFANLQAVLQAAGASMDDVVKFSITIKHNAVRDAINAQWLATFPNPDDRPARHIVVADLQHGMELQIEALAVIR